MRFVTLNLWGERGPVEARMGLVGQGLAALDPDVVALQEVRVLPGKLPNQAETLAAELGMHATFAPAMEWGGGVEGVALLTRKPPTHSVVRELPHASDTLRRVLLLAHVDTPDGAVHVATTHLHYRLEDGMVREDQVLAIDAVLGAAPPSVFCVLLGDFNATPDSDEIRFLTGKVTLRGRRTFFQDAWARRHPEAPGHTWAVENPYTAEMSWLHPGRRIDYVFVTREDRDGRGEIGDCGIALHSPDPTGVYPSDHFALVADVRIGPRTSG